MGAPSSTQMGWYNDHVNGELDIYVNGTKVIAVSKTQFKILGTAQTVNVINDNIIFALGTDSDVAMVEKAAGLAANTTLTGVLVGTPVVPIAAADSLIVGNVTASGDMIWAVNRGGNSNAVMKASGALGTMSLYYQGVLALVTSSAGLTVSKVIGSYNGIATAGYGVAPVQASAKLTAISTTQSSIATVTPPAAASTFRVNIAHATTSGTNTGNVTYTITFTNAAGVSATVTVSMMKNDGSVSTTPTGASTTWSGTAILSTDNSAGAITVVGTVSGTVACDINATIEQLA